MAQPKSLKISVLVTTHEQPTYLRKVLTGYLDQTRPPDEIIVADDGSGKPTADVVNEFTRRAAFPVIHVWQQHTKVVRLSHLRNLATRASKGDYIIYTDGDCVPTRHFVADHEQLARPGWFTQGKRMWIKESILQDFTGREKLLHMLYHATRRKLTKPHYLLHRPGRFLEKLTIEGVRGCNMAFFRDTVEQVNGHNQDFVGFWRQDSEFALRVMRSGVRRQDALFSAMLFHLEHEKPLVIADLERNSHLLAKARTGPIYTPNGLLSTQLGNSTDWSTRKAA
ncbi:MAG: glycosyltransferase [Pirellulaceae bacterium]|nr:glycosyltransferase [Pirellulaceae bacterium]